MKHKQKRKLARRLQSKREAKIKGENGSIFNSSAWNVRKLRRQEKEQIKMIEAQDRREARAKKKLNCKV